MRRKYDLQTQYERMGSRIRDLRKEAGMTQVQLSEATGILSKHISRIEDGGQGLGGLLHKIAEALGMQLDFVPKRKSKKLRDRSIEIRSDKNSKKVIARVKGVEAIMRYGKTNARAKRLQEAANEGRVKYCFISKQKTLWTIYVTTEPPAL